VKRRHFRFGSEFADTAVGITALLSMPFLFIAGLKCGSALLEWYGGLVFRFADWVR
jgi:hypothetical protein